MTDFLKRFASCYRTHRRLFVLDFSSVGVAGFQLIVTQTTKELFNELAEGILLSGFFSAAPV